MKKTGQKIKNFLKTIISGLIGAGIFFMFCIMAFAIAKIIFWVMKRDLIITRYNISVAVLIFMIFGFAYGISSYLRRNSYRKTFTPRWKNIALDILLSLIFTIITYVIIKQKYSILLTTRAVLLVFALFLVLFYAFSALIVQISKPPKTHKHRPRNIFWATIVNPVFVLIALGLFIAVVYNSLYIPCGVTIVGTDNNKNTANTQELGIDTGEKIVSIDNEKIQSLQDIKRYLSSLKSAKEVLLETEDKIYYIKTYESDDNIYMGLLLKQEYCPSE